MSSRVPSLWLVLACAGASCSPCPEDQVRRDGRCVYTCNSPSDCRAVEACVDGACMPADRPVNGASGASSMPADSSSTSNAATSNPVPSSSAAAVSSGPSSSSAPPSSAPPSSAPPSSGGASSAPSASSAAPSSSSPPPPSSSAPSTSILTCVICWHDADGDGHGTGTGQQYCNGCPPGWSEVVTALDDCDDGNAAVFPGQGAYFDQPRLGGSYDYNCDDVTEQDLVVFDCSDCSTQGAAVACGAPVQSCVDGCGNPGVYTCSNYCAGGAVQQTVRCR